MCGGACVVVSALMMSVDDIVIAGAPRPSTSWARLSTGTARSGQSNGSIYTRGQLLNERKFVSI